MTINNIYNQLLSNRIVCVFGEINQEIANATIAELLLLDQDSHEDISLYINTPGGDLSAALAIIDTMNLIKSDVSTVNISGAHSAGGLLLTSGTKGKRYVLPSSQMLVHEPLTSTGNGFVSATGFENITEKILKKRQTCIGIFKNSCNLSEKKLLEMMKEDTMLDAEEIVQYGFADRILK